MTSDHTSEAGESQVVVAFAGGVGGAKMAHGLAKSIGSGLTVVVNTADDFDLHGLRICPDLDTVLYTLAGLANPATGWGIAGDTLHAQGALTRLGVDPWFTLGDQDLATHILRTQRLRAGNALSSVIAEFARQLGVTARILPMTDDPVATSVVTAAGELEFQDYFVRRRQQDEVLGVRFRGIELSRPAPEVIGGIGSAQMIVFCPSNPIVSIGPILAVPGIRAAIERSVAPRIAVSPIIGGKALKGPADRMLASLGYEVSPRGIARIYDGLIDGLVIDNQDADLADDIRASGLRVLVTQSIMGDEADRRRFADEVIEFGESLIWARATAS